MFTVFDTVHERDRETDGHTDTTILSLFVLWAYMWIGADCCAGALYVLVSVTCAIVITFPSVRLSRT